MCRQQMYHTKVKREQPFQTWIQNYMFDLVVQMNSQMNECYRYPCTVDTLKYLLEKLVQDTSTYIVCWTQHYKNNLPDLQFEQQITQFLNKQLLNTRIQTFQQY